MRVDIVRLWVHVVPVHVDVAITIVSIVLVADTEDVQDFVDNGALEVLEWTGVGPRGPEAQVEPY